jgi:hypothetical protein
MRTKALLALAAFVVSAATCVAQSNVYSLNIVGYVNVDVIKGLNLIANPLKPSDGNYNITNTITLPDEADGAQIYTWAGSAWSTTIPNWIAGFGWDPAVSIPLGEAFFLSSPVATKITFVGEVQTGDAIPYTMNPGLNVVANKVPVDQNWPGKAVGQDGDQIYTWAGTAWDNAIYGFIEGFGWDNGTPTSNVDGPMLKAGQGAIYSNSKNTAYNFTQKFNP